MKQLKVGIGSRNYGYRRVCYELPVEGTSFHKVAYFPWRLGTNSPRLYNTWFFQPFSQVDLYHLWNGVCFNRKPWITNFEHGLPRYCEHPRDAFFDRCVKRIQGENCRALLPLSDYARHAFLHDNRDWIDDSVTEKTEVFYGALTVDEKLVEKHAQYQRQEKEEFVLMMVGHDFFRKGGVPLLRAFERLRDELPHLRLRVVSNLSAGDYATNTPDSERERIKQQLLAEDRIEWHETVPFAQVLEMFATSDFAVLPTLDDTFGWAALEPMSMGVPIVVTNICAMPEIVASDRGFQIELPQLADRRWRGMEFPVDSGERAEALALAYDTICEGLCRTIRNVYENRNQLPILGEAAIEHVRRVHDPKTLAKKLGDIYRRALS